MPLDKDKDDKDAKPKSDFIILRDFCKVEMHCLFNVFTIYSDKFKKFIVKILILFINGALLFRNYSKSDLCTRKFWQTTLPDELEACISSRYTYDIRKKGESILNQTPTKRRK